MIIPPDPEKDPNLFVDPSLSEEDGRSLLDAQGVLTTALPGATAAGLGGHAAETGSGRVVFPPPAHLGLPALGYGAYGYPDDLGVGFTGPGEALPPYTSGSGGRHSLERERRARDSAVILPHQVGQAPPLPRRPHGHPRSPPQVSSASPSTRQAPPLPRRPHRHPYGQYSPPPPPTEPHRSNPTQPHAGPSSPPRTHARHPSSPTTRRSRRPQPQLATNFPLSSSFVPIHDPALDPYSPSSPALPSADAASDTLVDPSSSTHKLWESSSFPSSPSQPSGPGKRRRLRLTNLGLTRISSGISSIPSFVPDKYQKPWRKYRRWIYFGIGLTLLALGIIIGVAVSLGLRAAAARAVNSANYGAGTKTSWQDNTPGSSPDYDYPTGGDAKHSVSWASGEDLNLTYVEPRDDPPPSMGSMTVCPRLGEVDAGFLKALGLLSVPYPGQKAAGARFRIPINANASSSTMANVFGNTTWNSTSSISPATTTATPAGPYPLPNPGAVPGSSSSVALNSSSALLSALSSASGLFFLSNGLGSVGTLEWAGQDAPVQILQGGEEGVIKVDVVMYYPGSWGNLSLANNSSNASSTPPSQASTTDPTFDPSTIARVCGLARTDGTLGIGIFTPIQTEGKVTNPYMMNPAQVPGWHILVRVPPSLYGVTAVGSAGSSSGPSATSASASATSALSIPTFVAQLSRMALRFGETAPGLSFGTWNVTSGRGGVTVGSVRAGTVGVWSAENAIKGRWEVGQGIMLNNTDSAVVAEVVLLDPSATVGSAAAPQVLEAPELVQRDSGASTSNGGSNDSTTAHTIPALFSTANSFLSVAFLAHPASVALQAAVSNTGGDINVALHPGYVGAWAVRNYWGQVRVPPPGLEVPTYAPSDASGGGAAGNSPASRSLHTSQRGLGTPGSSQFHRRGSSGSTSTALSSFDPWNQGRSRQVVFGAINPTAPVNLTTAGPLAALIGLPLSGTVGVGVLAQAGAIDVQPGYAGSSASSYTAASGMGSGTLPGGLDEAMWITGAAYWASASASGGSGSAEVGESEDGSIAGWTADLYAQSSPQGQGQGQGQAEMTAAQVQSSAEGRDSQVLISGGWGDVRLSFDGT